MKQTTLDAPAAYFHAPPVALCLAFANTLSRRGAAVADEALPDASALLAWVAQECGASDAMMARSRGDNGLLAAAISLREVVYSLFAPPNAGLASLLAFDALCREAPARARLLHRNGRLAWHVGEPVMSASTLLAPVLWSAADLLSGTQRDRVRSCADLDCRRLFLDDSKGGTRRWCSMSGCGNRAKAQRFKTRRRAGRLSSPQSPG